MNKYENDWEDAVEEPALDTLELKYDQSQKELVTQTVDFNVKNLANMVNDQQVDTSPKYQRRLRWDDERSSKLIESLLMNVPIPPLFFAEERYGKYAVIDGQQRLQAISSFFSNMLELKGLEVFTELNGKRFAQIPQEIQSILNMRPTLRCIIILKQSDPQIKFEVFERLNTGGVHLNPQEIRNSAYRGPLNSKIIDLSESVEFRRLLGIEQPNDSRLVQEMKDCELVLRFFAMKDSYDSFTGKLKYVMNNFMERNQYMDDEGLERISEDFRSTLLKVSCLFGDKCFKRFNPTTGSWNNQILASVYDAQMIACYQVEFNCEEISEDIRYQMQLKLENLYFDEQFQYAIGAGTNQKSKIEQRIMKTKYIIEDTLNENSSN